MNTPVNSAIFPLLIQADFRNLLDYFGCNERDLNFRQQTQPDRNS